MLSQLTSGSNDEDKMTQASSERSDKTPFSPRTKADINQLIDELDAAIEPGGKSKTKSRYVLSSYQPSPQYILLILTDCLMEFSISDVA